MPTARATAAKAGAIEVEAPEVHRFEIGILGKTASGYLQTASGYLHAAMSQKAQRELLLPRGRLNAAAKAANLKHDPVKEFRDSVYRLADPDAPTLLATKAEMYKGAMMSAALDLPGTSKAQIGRLVWVLGDYLPLWGTAHLQMDIVRSADINRTPDIRTRAVSEQWGTILTIEFVSKLITQSSVLALLVGAGQMAGVGDYRPQKGKGTHGQFEVVDVDDPRLEEVMKYDRAYQVAAMEAAEPFDQRSAELLDWYVEERQARGK